MTKSRFIRYKKLPTTYTDQELAERLQKGDSGAFREIYRRHWWHLYGVALRKTRSKETAEEVVQDVFTKVWIRREQISISHSWEAYLTSAVQYAIINHLQAALVRQKHLRGQQMVTTPECNLTEESLSARELQQQVSRGIARLPEKTQEIFVLSRYRHQSNRDIAHQMHLSEKAVEYHISKAIKQLKFYLKDFLPTIVMIIKLLIS